ncbi:MAG: DUF362 domain-containing protein, partial [Pirellulales bacterium]
MPDNSRHGFSRRAFLAGTALGAAGGGALGWNAWRWSGGRQPSGQAPVAAAENALGMPGKYAGQVVEVHHERSVLESQQDGYTGRDHEVVRQMVGRGLQELVGSDDEVEAWRSFFQRGDRVGIKVVPVGKPDSISSHELIHAVVEGLKSANVRTADILVFDRYKTDFMSCNYHRLLPDGVAWECSSAAYDDLQLEIDGQAADRKQPRQPRVAGYDRDVYRELAYCQPGCDPKDDRRFRSHLGQIISRKIDKFISLPVLKDHRSGGITMALKNLSHGSVNNVARSHISQKWQGQSGPVEGGTLNQCGTFIPAIASLPVLREK